MIYNFKILLSFIPVLLFSYSAELRNEPINFKNAISMTTDGKGYIYVLDNEANEIVKLSSDLTFVKRMGKKGWDYGEFDTPTYIDGSSGLDIYVCDGKNFRVQRFDLNLAFVSALITNTETFDNNFKFNNPVASVIMHSSELYIIDGDNPRIIKYLDSQTPVLSFAGYQSVDASLSKPVKILKDSYNSLYVFDKGRNAVMVYDNFGNFIKSIKYGNVVSVSIYKDVLYILNSDYEVVKYDARKGALSDKFSVLISSNPEKIKDFLVYSSDKFFILEKDNLNFYKY